MHDRGPERLSEVLSRLFAARGWGQQQARRRLEEAWRDAVGEVGAGATRLGALRHGTLEVIVSNPVLIQELANFQKRELLKKLADQLGKERVKEIRFRLGEVGRISNPSYADGERQGGRSDG